jgi:ribosomal RNA-processing protein 9
MKRRGAQKSGQAARKPPKAAGKDDHLEWQGNSSGDESAEEEEVEEEDNRETPDNKRIRLAKEYLDRLKEEEESSGSESGSDDESGSDEDRVGAKLHRDVERALGKLFIPVAENLDEVGIDVDAIRRFRGHQLSVTAIAVADDEASVFTGSKDCSVLKWDVETGTRIAMMGRNGLPKGETPEPGSKRTHQNQAEVLAVAASTDGKFVACAGRDKLVHVFDTRSCELLQSFKGHQDAITSLAFRHNTHTLFSGGLDRVIKNWNLDHMEYVESLYGHQSEVFGLDSMHNDRCVSAGRDRTLRMWKIPEESQLVFNHSGGSIDCVRMLAEQYYVTGGEVSYE